MLFSSALLPLLALAPAVFAAPVEDCKEKVAHAKPNEFPSWKRAFENVMRHRYNRAPQGEWPNADATTCDTAAAQMPIAPTPLPSPAAGMVLSHVAIGHGTQNYTCTSNSPTETPTAVGAVATLYNATCVACDWPDLLALMPTVALNTKLASGASPNSFTQMMTSGHHYFLDSTTPFFNLDTDTHTYGTIAAAKNATSDPPADAPLGLDGSGYGSVGWLKLTAKDGEGNPFQEVYRLNTAGGNPPPTCEDHQGAFQVPYAAQYWLWVKAS